MERLIGDALSLLAEPQATELDRIQLAFDLLDKAESLLGYTRRETGKGFEGLLRRGQSRSSTARWEWSRRGTASPSRSGRSRYEAEESSRWTGSPTPRACASST